MTLAFDIPACKPSFVGRLDPRWKLAAISLAAISFGVLRGAEPAIVALAGAVLLAISAKLPWRWYLRRLATAMVLFALFLIWRPFIVEDGDATFTIGFLTLSVTGVEWLLAVGAKLAAMISLMLVLLATAPLQDTFKAAHSLRVPGLLVHLALLTYRYVFLLMEEFARLRTALRVRGFRNRVDLHSYRTIGQVAGTLLVRSQERSERVAQAMRCRGYDGQFRSLHVFRTAWTDVLALVVVVGFAACLLIWDWFAR